MTRSAVLALVVAGVSLGTAPVRAEGFAPNLGAAAEALGPVIEGAVRVGDRLCLGVYAGYCSYRAMRVERRFQRGEINHEARVEEHYKIGLGFFGSLAGGALGAAGGALACAPLGPAGMLIGGIAGGIGGSLVGERLGFRHAAAARQLIRRGLDAASTAVERLRGRIRGATAAVAQSRPVQAVCRFRQRLKERVERVWR